MKWFKHYSNATDGETLQNLFRKYGLEGEARYWRLVQLLAKQYDGSTELLYFSLETIRQSLRHRSLTDCRSFLDHLTTISGMVVHYSGNDCQIKYPKLSEIKDNHVKNLQVTGKKLAHRLDIDKDKELDKELNTMPKTIDDEHQLKRNKKPTQSDANKLLAKSIRENYISGYQNRYGVKPTWAAKENSLVKILISRVGQEALELSANYLTYNDPWHIQQKHPFGLLVSQLDKIRVELNNPNRMLDHHQAKKQIEKYSDESLIKDKREKEMQDFLNKPDEIDYE